MSYTQSHSSCQLHHRIHGIACCLQAVLVCLSALTWKAGLSSLSRQAVESGPSRDAVLAHRADDRLAGRSGQAGEAGLAERACRSGAARRPGQTVLARLPGEDESGPAGRAARTVRARGARVARLAGQSGPARQTGLSFGSQLTGVSLDAAGALHRLGDDRVVDALGADPALGPGPAGEAGLAPRPNSARPAVQALVTQSALLSLLSEGPHRAAAAVLAAPAQVSLNTAHALVAGRPCGATGAPAAWRTIRALSSWLAL